MIIYGYVGSLPDGWTAAQVEGLLGGWAWPGRLWYATMDEKVWGVSGRAEAGRAGSVFYGHGADPESRLMAQVGGGAGGKGDWYVWRLRPYDLGCDPMEAGEHQRLVDRAIYLRQQIRIHEEHHRLHPEEPWRDPAVLRLELAHVEEMLRCWGNLELVVYLGYAGRVGGDRYWLPAR